MQGNTDPGSLFTIRDCTNNGSVNGSAWASGIFGACIELTTATNANTKMVFDGCINTGDVTTTAEYVGGIASKLYTACKVEFIECINSSDATLTATGNVGKIGGIAGLVDADASFTKCTNYAAIETLTKGSGTDFAGLGGIAGMINEGSNVTFTECKNKGALTLGENGTLTSVGGILGMSVRSNTTLINCENEADITNEAKESSHYNGIGGIVGFNYAYGVTGDSFAVIGCKNSGAILHDTTCNTGSGGIVGTIRATSNALIEGCENSGSVTSTKTDNGYATFSAGILGAYGTNGLGWDGKIDGILTVRDCINTGAISGYRCIAGILGSTMEINITSTVITIESCSNFGAVTAATTAGAGIVAKFDGAVEGSKLLINNCLNVGSVNVGGELGDGHGAGIFAAANSKATVEIDSCVNFGSIYAKGWESSGIIGQASDGGGYDTKFVKNCVNLGTITGSDGKPKAIGGAKQENCYALITSCNNTGGGKGVYIAEALDMAAETGVMVFYRDHLKAYIDAMDEFLDGILETKYDEFTLADLRAALAEAKRVYALNAMDYTEIDEIVLPDMLKQAEIHAAYEALVEARENLLYADQKIELLDRTIAEAEELYASDVIYTSTSWKVFTDALKAAKDLRASDNIADRDTDDIVNAIANVRGAIEALVRGGEIRNEADFALLNGQNGTFELMTDITVSVPVENFSGVLNGNGYTITVKGSGLFKNFSGATVRDLTVAGDAGDAASIFGKASGNATVANVDVEVETLAVAAIFDSAASDAHVTISDVISYASSAETALVGKLGCRASISNVIVMGSAATLAGELASGSVISYAYLYAVEYYSEDGGKSTDLDVLASGKVAYEMNEQLGDIILVQILGEDAAPKIGAAMADGMNVVIKVDDEYRNKGHKYDSGIEDFPEVPDVDPIAPYYGGLEAAIERAEALNKDDYTADSWAALEAALANAKAALQSTVQAEIDAASSALTISAAGLKKASSGVSGETVDYSKLEEVIAQAEALKASDYTDGTWATLQAMLAMAKAAKRSNEQEAVDSAKAALQSAITNLAKAPAATDAPKDEPKPTEPAKDEGCGGLVGGAAIVAIAVVALGTGISFKKKED